MTLGLTITANGRARAQTASSATTFRVWIAEMTLVAEGWSVRKSILGRTMSNDGEQKVGVNDSPEASAPTADHQLAGVGAAHQSTGLTSGAAAPVQGGDMMRVALRVWANPAPDPRRSTDAG